MPETMSLDEKLAISNKAYALALTVVVTQR